MPFDFCKLLTFRYGDKSSYGQQSSYGGQGQGSEGYGQQSSYGSQGGDNYSQRGSYGSQGQGGDSYSQQSSYGGQGQSGDSFGQQSSYGSQGGGGGGGGGSGGGSGYTRWSDGTEFDSIFRQVLVSRIENNFFGHNGILSPVSCSVAEMTTHIILIGLSGHFMCAQVGELNKILDV